MINQELILEALKSLRKEKIILKKMIEKRVNDDNEENIESMQPLYRDYQKNTIDLVEEIIKKLQDTPQTMESLSELIKICSNRYYSPEESAILASKLEQLIVKQLLLHKNINFCLANLNNVETYASLQSINGEYTMYLYSLMLDYAKEQKDPKFKNLIIKKMSERFLNEDPIKYMFIGDIKLAEYFCNPTIFLSDDFICKSLYIQSSIMLKKIIELIQLTSALSDAKDSFPNEKTKEIYNKLIEYDLTAYLIQCEKYGYVPDLDLENIDKKTLSRIQDSVNKATEYAKKYNFENKRKVYRKAK